MKNDFPSRDLKQNITNAVLVDDLDKARSLVNEAKDLDLLSSLIAKSANCPPPLQWLKSDYPKFVHIPTSFTCGMACQMCFAGFHDRSSLFDDRKHFLPEEFDKLQDWIDTASYVHLIGDGETLNSPHIPYFLDRVAGKTSIITTSGAPLNKDKIAELIKSGLHYLNFSFDGTTSIGHGGNDESYATSFWEKVKLVEDTKNEYNSSLPILIISVSVNSENVAQLDEICSKSYQNKIQIIGLLPMLPRDQSLLHKSIFSNFEVHLDEIGRVMSKWNQREMTVTFFNQNEINEGSEYCDFVDNYMLFNGPRPKVCCGPLNLPLHLGDHNKDTSWNSFPLRYLRYMHLSEKPKQQPLACQNCSQVNFERAKTAVPHLIEFPEKDTALILYRTASQLKQNKHHAEAEETFIKLLELPMDWPLKGKIYFHLGELALHKSNYPQALSFMKLAVQYCFDHKMAFIYLYFLMMLLEKPQIPKTGFVRKETYLEKISQSLGISLEVQP